MFEWALRDTVQGRRGIVLLAAALLPALFVGLIGITVEPFSGDELDAVAAAVVTSVILPPLIAVFGIVAGGTVLRQPVEDGTAVYFLTRPVPRWRTAVSRMLAAALVVGALAVVAALALVVPLGAYRVVLEALPALFVAGFALGAFYAFLMSVHRFALGAVIAHAVIESYLAHVPFGVRKMAVSWHAWSAMGEAATVAEDVGIVPELGGTLLVPGMLALMSFVLIGAWYTVRPFGLGVAES